MLLQIVIVSVTFVAEWTLDWVVTKVNVENMSLMFALGCELLSTMLTCK